MPLKANEKWKNKADYVYDGYMNYNDNDVYILHTLQTTKCVV